MWQAIGLAMVQVEESARLPFVITRNGFLLFSANLLWFYSGGLIFGWFVPIEGHERAHALMMATMGFMIVAYVMVVIAAYAWASRERTPLLGYNSMQPSQDA